ncbi:helix-turn-helix domain-containing protein [Citromicrobium bathyomarinum]
MPDLSDTADTPETRLALAPQDDAALPAIPEQFSREAQADFLDALAQGGNVRAACAAAGISRSTAYRMRRACGRFEQLWDAALLVARTQVEAVLADRALNGVEETIFYHGEAVATRRRYDARLLLAHLARLDRLTQNTATYHAAIGFDDALGELLDAPELVQHYVEFDAPAGEGEG